jgi:hypothetical protein
MEHLPYSLVNPSVLGIKYLQLTQNLGFISTELVKINMEKTENIKKSIFYIIIAIGI